MMKIILASAVASCLSVAVMAQNCVFGAFDGTRCVCIGESFVPSATPGYCRDASGACTVVREWNGDSFEACESTPSPPPPTGPTYRITSPSSSKEMVVGTTETLSWAVTPIPNNDKVRLTWIPLDGGAEIYIMGNINSTTGSYEYKVPQFLSGRQLRLKLFAHPSRFTAVSDDIISIVGGKANTPTYKFTSPLKTATWIKGSTQVITWDVEPFPCSEKVKIMMFAAGSTQAILIGEFPANDRYAEVVIDDRFTVGTPYRQRLVSKSVGVNNSVWVRIGSDDPTPPPPSSGLPAGGCVYGNFNGRRCVCIGESNIPSATPGYCRDQSGACTIARVWTGSAFAAC
jgi:hypothetical protein